MRLIRLFLSLLLLTSLLLSGCTNRSTQSESFSYMNTVITIELPSGNYEKQFSECSAQISAYDALFSKTNADSEISKWNADHSFIFSDNTAGLLTTALNVSKHTNGAFSLSIAPISYLWKDVFTSENPVLPQQQAITNALWNVDDSRLNLDAGTLLCDNAELQIEVGGCAKGYACQKIMEYLENETDWGILSFGGNIGVFGEKPDKKPFHIGIKNPWDTDKVVGYVDIDSGFVSVSGNYERYCDIDGVRYHHIINPATGYPAESGLDSVAVICKDGALGDALSTALFVLGYDRAMELYRAETYDFEAVFCTSDQKVLLTDGLKNQYTSAD